MVARIYAQQAPWDENCECPCCDAKKKFFHGLNKDIELAKAAEQPDEHLYACAAAIPYFVDAVFVSRLKDDTENLIGVSASIAVMWHMLIIAAESCVPDEHTETFKQTALVCIMDMMTKYQTGDMEARYDVNPVEPSESQTSH